MFLSPINIIKSPFLGLFLLLLSFQLDAQNIVLIKGTVLDQKDQIIPYATIAIKDKYIGTVTNASGYFELKVDQESQDTLSIDMLGYQKLEFAVDALRDSNTYYLEEEHFVIDEIVIRPKPPEHYIKLATRNIKSLAYDKGYNTISYFREDVKINEVFLGESESVYKSYAYAHKKHKYQLMLHRGTYNDSMDNGIFFTDDDPRDFAMGPEFIMYYANDKSIDYFLDSNYFDKYRYHFAPDTLSGYMIIGFEPKGKIEHMKMGGQIILESKTFAIVEVKFSGILKIPIIAKPLLAAFGYGYRTPYFDAVKKYQNIEGKWFPSYTRLEGGMTLINKHLFRKNDVYVYDMKQIFHVNKIIKSRVKAISNSKKYDVEKPYVDQIHNDDQLKWSDINVIKN